jgi:drug/metabolite transporter (DMT)-like permease
MIANRSPRPRWAAKPLVALLLLGFLEAIPTLRADLFPDPFAGLLPPLQRQILSLALLAVLATLVSVVRRSPWPGVRSLATGTLIGFGLFVIPAVLLEITRPWLSPVTRAALLTLTPFFAVIFEPYLTQRSAQQSRAALPACLATIAGALLVLPVTMPDSLPAVAAVVAIGAAAASIAAATCLAIRTLSSVAKDAAPTQLSIAPFAAIACAAASFGLIVLAIFSDHPSFAWNAVPSTLAWSAATELPALLLLFWLLSRVSAPRLSIRFALSLLFPILIGAPLLHSHLSARDWCGVALMVAGTAYLLLAPEDNSEFLGLSLH